MDRAYSTNEGEEECVIKPEGKRQLGRPRHRRVDIVRTDLGERENEVVWTGLVRLRKGTSGELLRMR
jgi:hypothetical protein